MWTEIARAKSARDGGRYASDLREAEWRPIAPDMPARKPLGRRRSTDLREAVNAILYVLRTGCPWRMLAKEFPPWRTVYRYFSVWRDSGLWMSIGHRLMLKARKAEGRRAASSSAGVVDSQSVKTTEGGGPHGFDAGKKVKGRKRHILTDTGGLPITAQVHTADIRGRDGAPKPLASGRAGFPWLRHAFADGAYAGPKLRTALEGKGGGGSGCKTLRHHARLQAVAAPMGRRMDIGLAEPSPASGQGLRGNHRHGAGMALHRERAASHPKNGKSVKLKFIRYSSIMETRLRVLHRRKNAQIHRANEANIEAKAAEDLSAAFYGIRAVDNAAVECARRALKDARV